MTSPIIGEYCDSIPSTIVTTSNEVFIRFQTNAVYTEAGWKMEYNAISNLDDQITRTRSRWLKINKCLHDIKRQKYH